MDVRQILRCCSPATRSQGTARRDPAGAAKMRALSKFAAAAFAIAAAMQPLAAQQAEFRCAPLLPSASRTPPYSRVPGKERCEGYFEQTVSQSFIELLSLTRNRPDAPQLAGASLLQIRARSGALLQLIIQPLRPSPFYRVDSRLAAGRALEWNAAPMLASTGLRLSDLGFLARAASPDPATPMVAPLSLSAAADDAALAYAVLRVSVPVSSVAARQYRSGPGAAGSGSWRELPGTPLYAWDTIVLPIALAGDGPEIRVDVRAVDVDGRLLPMLQFVVADH